VLPDDSGDSGGNPTSRKRRVCCRRRLTSLSPRLAGTRCGEGGTAHVRTRKGPRKKKECKRGEYSCGYLSPHVNKIGSVSVPYYTVNSGRDQKKKKKQHVGGGKREGGSSRCPIMYEPKRERAKWGRGSRGGWAVAHSPAYTLR